MAVNCTLDHSPGFSALFFWQVLVSRDDIVTECQELSHLIYETHVFRVILWQDFNAVPSVEAQLDLVMLNAIR